MSIGIQRCLTATMELPWPKGILCDPPRGRGLRGGGRGEGGGAPGVPHLRAADARKANDVGSLQSADATDGAFPLMLPFAAGACFLAR